jgi:predicted Zn-dependent protease
MQEYFYALADAITALLHGDELYTCSFHGEDSDFVRFSKSAIRQAGTVAQRFLSIDLIRGSRHATGEISLTGELDSDRDSVTHLLAGLRKQLAYLPEDPYLFYATEVHSSTLAAPNRLPDTPSAVNAILEAGDGRDLVGFYAAGGIYAGFANAIGQRNWFSNYSFNCDWSFYHQRDKAVKAAYAGFTWDPSAFAHKVETAALQLDILRQSPRTIAPGPYRVYLAPDALYDVLQTLSWGGFGLKDHRTKQTTLLKMAEEGLRLHPTVTIQENTRDGVAPNFQEAGFIKPDTIPLIRAGALGECLVSPRSAKEYGVASNGASARESPQSLDIEAGALPPHDILRQLDTGIYINNVWYLNYSDRSSCRMTGMTRFATFWVEHGVIQAPLNVMRFDESMYRMLGDNLLALTAEREFLLDTSTYHRRSTHSGRLPGALINDFHFTL